jgi:hypothetical protein
MKLSDDTVNKLKTAFSIGADVSAACFYAEISRQTYYNWVEENITLAEEFDRLREKPVLKAYQTIANKLDEVETAKWYLSRKRKDEFSLKIEVSDPGRISSQELSKEIKEAIQYVKTINPDSQSETSSLIAGDSETVSDRGEEGGHDVDGRPVDDSGRSDIPREPESPDSL